MIHTNTDDIAHHFYANGCMIYLMKVAFLKTKHTSFNRYSVSNLADIFEGDESEQNVETNPSLKYIPTKSNQSQKTTSTGNAEKSKWDVAIAKLVSAYKLYVCERQNNQKFDQIKLKYRKFKFNRVADANTSLGQLGLALLKNPTDGGAKLILYKTKDHILSSLQLTKATTVYWKPPYLQYHDSQQGFWSLFFTSDGDSTEFFAELGEVCTIDRTDASTASDINATENSSAAESTNTLTETSKSDSDKIESDALKSKSQVVHRVSKIGHQLPIMKPINADDDNDSALVSDTERAQNSQPSTKSVHSVSSDRCVYPRFQIPPKPTNISLALQPSSIWPSFASPSASSFDLNAFASENRIQNTEVRMNLTKLDSKLDRVLDNVERK